MQPSSIQLTGRRQKRALAANPAQAAVRVWRVVRRFHLGVVLIFTNFAIIGNVAQVELAGKRIPRPSAYGLASESIFLIATGSDPAMARP